VYRVCERGGEPSSARGPGVADAPPPNIFGRRPRLLALGAWAVMSTELDIRDLPPAERHDRIHETFTEIPSGEALTIINDHDPQPLFYEFQAEVEAFDADGYEVERRGVEEFVATLPKLPAEEVEG
jgi:uncharacterized protein (DUF2249 family)